MSLLKKISILGVLATLVLYTPATVQALSLSNFGFFSITKPTPPEKPTPPDFGHSSVPSATTIPTAKPTITPKPSSTPNVTPSPTIKPTATPTPKPASTPLPTQPSGSVRDYIMSKINDFRVSKGLSIVKTDSYTCSFAALRAKEISTNFNHDGFRNRINNKTIPYPGYKSITENIAMTSNYKSVVSLWINSPGHNANMQKDTPFVCVEAYGKYYAYEGWKP